MIVNAKNYRDLETGTVLIMERGVDGQEGYGKIVVELTDEVERSAEKMNYEDVYRQLRNRWNIIVKE